jgi:EAL domain-containing protein (putative c-di-GMP-specific phosphodiesterase class I)/GGDEF domain-containing protein/ferredoxin
MSERFVRGAIYTNDQCESCNRCISVCPVMGANVATIQEGKSRIEVDKRLCIACGSCVMACPHGARVYEDDSEKVFAALKSGEKFTLIVSPVFFLEFGKKSLQILAGLKALGVTRILDEAFGADLCLWRYLSFLEEAKKNGAGEGYISSFCPAFTNYYEKRLPGDLSRLAPIMPPYLCAAIYDHHVLQDPNPILYLSPCSGAMREIHLPETHGEVRYLLSLAGLEEHLSLLPLSKKNAQLDLSGFSFGECLFYPGGLKNAIDRFLTPEDVTLQIVSLSRADEIPAMEKDFTKAKARPLLITAHSCAFGCLSGPGKRKNGFSLGVASKALRSYVTALEKRDHFSTLNVEGRRALLKSHFLGVDPHLFDRSFVEVYQQRVDIPSDTREQIFLALNKKDKTSRKLDCRYCGYHSCEEMVSAIAYGYNKKENCVHAAGDAILELSRKDPLTGVYNKNEFLRQTYRMLTADYSISYTMGWLGVTNMRAINDLESFAEGDALLKKIAGLFREELPKNSTFSHYGDTGFAFCFPTGDEKQLERITQKTRRYAQKISGQVALHVSLGFCKMGDKDISVIEYVDNARLAYESVKNAFTIEFGVYNPAMKDKILGQASIANDMAKALANREFHIFVQPKVDHRSQKLIGGETLVRWFSPSRGIVSPGLFIPVFESTGFITALDKYVWEETAKLLRKWIDEGKNPRTLSTNVSRIDLYDPDFLPFLRRLYKKYRLPKALLQLEITESAYAQDAAPILKVISELSKEGFYLEMDDFGSGYSSLNMLKDVPVNLIKLDMKFFSHGNNEKGQAIIKKVVEMLKELDLAMIAEGVETKEQADFLSASGCDDVQGYLYSKPIPTEDFEAYWLKMNGSYAV